MSASEATLLPYPVLSIAREFDLKMKILIRDSEARYRMRELALIINNQNWDEKKDIFDPKTFELIELIYENLHEKIIDAVLNENIAVKYHFLRESDISPKIKELKRAKEIVKSLEPIFPFKWEFQIKKGNKYL